MVIWGDKASASISAIHTASPIGIFLAPIIVTPFLSDDARALMAENATQVLSLLDTVNVSYTQPFAWERNSSTSKTMFEHTTSYLERNDSTFSMTSTPHVLSGRIDLVDIVPIDNQFETQVYIPYAIGGLFGVLVAIIYGVFHFQGHSYDEMEAELVKPKNDVNHSKKLINDLGNPTFYIMTLSTLCLLYIIIIGRDYCFTLYIFTIAVKSHLQMPKRQAGLLNTSYNVAMAVGRIISTIISTVIPIQIIVFYQCVITVIVLVLLVLFGLDGVVPFWILTCLLGIFVSPTVPSFLAWANRYIVCNGFAVAIIDIGIGVGGLLGTWINGLIFQKYNGQGLLVFAMYLSVAVLVIFIPMQAFAHWQGDRHLAATTQRTKSPMQDEPNESTYLISSRSDHDQA